MLLLVRMASPPNLFVTFHALCDYPGSGLSLYVKVRGGSSVNPYRYCHSPAHGLTRRGFFAASGAGLLAGPALLSDNVALGSPQAAELKRNAKAVIIFYLGGGASQLETWDPK